MGNWHGLFILWIGEIHYIASGIRVPIAEGQRTSLYLMAACKLTLSTIFGVLWKIYRGVAFENTENLWMEETREIEILGNPANPDVEFDGDPVGYLPCKVSLAEDELVVLCRVGIVG